MSLNFFTSIGGGDEIGASSYFVKIAGEKILLDAGIRLNSYLACPRYEYLFEKGIIDGLWDLSAVFLSHGHLDHIGSLPKIVQEAPDVPIYATHPTADITRLQLEDTLRFEEREHNASHDVDISLFSRGLLDKAINSISLKDYNNTIELRDARVTFFPAGHILGAAMTYIETDQGNILYTGDFADFDQMTVMGYSLPDSLKVDVLISESTYGFRDGHDEESLRQQRMDLAMNVSRVVESGGTALIPAFAVGRSQEIALILSFYIYEGIIPSIPIWMDGKVRFACRVFEEHGIPIYSDFVQDVPMGKFAEGGVIIASSGMLLKKSKSAAYAKKLLPFKENALFFTGYLDEETPGSELIEIKERGCDCHATQVMANVESYGLSAHADCDGILNLISHTLPKKVILVHGERHSWGVRDIREEIYERFGSCVEIFTGGNGVAIDL